MSAHQWSGGGFAHIEVIWQKLYYDVGGTYLITVMSGISSVDAVTCSAYPQARAVMNEFGDLVLVRGWL